MSDTNEESTSIKPIDTTSVHRITSGQVVVDLQTAVKELVENALDAGATNIEIKFKEQGLTSIEVVDNGSGIAPADYDSVALKHHTSKLASFSDLTTVLTFGFRGEALSSLCAVCEKVSVTTATASSAPVGTVLELARSGAVVSSSGRAARQRGTTVTLTSLFSPLPVRRKELERHIKREFGRVLTLLQAYALVPCSVPDRPVRLTVSNADAKGKKTVHLKTTGVPGTRGAVSALWGPKTLDPLVDLELSFDVAPDKTAVKRLRAARAEDDDGEDIESGTGVEVKGLISKFVLGCGRTGTDRQFFFVNGRPCALPKVQKAVNDVYRAFNVNQTPFVVADFMIPTASVDINVSPDKRTLFLHAEQNLLEALKVALEERFAPSRSTFNVNGTQTPALTLTQGTLPFTQDLPQLQDAVTSFPASSQITDARPTAAPDVVSTARRLRTRTFEVSDEEATRPSTPQFPSSSTPTTDQEPDPDFPLSSARLLASASFSSSISVRTDYSDFPRTPATPPISSSAPRGPNSTVLCRTFGRSSVLGSQSPLPPTFELRARRDTADTPSKVRPAPPGPLFLESDEEDNQGAEQPKESSPEVIMSTQGASWAREPSLSPDSEERAAAKHLRHASITSENLDDEDVVPAKRPPSPKTERAAKRAKMGVQPAASRGVLRSRLASFAAPGSQVVTRASSSEAEEILGAEEENEDSLEPSEEPQLPTQPSSSKRHREQSTMRELFRATLEDAPMANYDPDDVQMSDTPVIPAVFDILRTREPTGATPVLDGDAILSLDIDRVRSRWQRLDASADTTLPDTSSTQAQAASLTSAAADADAALSRLITKDDFAQMEILGQFNLGFIVTRLGQDLWIVDQHAADEKYNFEDLQKHTRIQSQRLVQPRALELSAADELVAREHVDVLRQNGFEVDVGENSVEDDMEEGGDEPRRRGLHLVAQPISKNTVFDTHDLEEIIQLLHDRPHGGLADGVVRSTKARAMFASRACRKSVMIGMPLKKAQMTTVVQHMGAMDQPWNCPHGRPTMRHLCDLRGQVQPRAGKVDWAAFAAESS